MQCDVRLADDPTPFLDGTKIILLLGEYAMHKYVPSSRTNSLNELRGSILDVGGIPAIASFFPQDAIDPKNHEGELNEQSKEYNYEESGERKEKEETDEKSHSPTSRSNYAFWLRADCKKAIRILRHGRVENTPPEYRIWPSSSDIISVLSNTKNDKLFIDIETDYEEQNLLCVGFAFSTGPIYCFPVLDCNYKWAYSSLHNILRALANCMRDNLSIAHNGASFDFPVLTSKYSICPVRMADTMIINHRIFPDIEKSLGHCISYWTDLPFHKDMDSRAYCTTEHMKQKMKYCALDVYGMREVYNKQMEYAARVPGLLDSIECANNSIRPYMITSLQGIKYSPEKVQELITSNDRLMNQYIRFINLLIGPVSMIEVKKSIKDYKKAKSFPNSNSQCCKYFHDMLGYSVIRRSKKTGKPSLAAVLLYKLALKYPDNPVITFTLLFRQLAKETSTLKFQAYKGDDDKVIKVTDDTSSEQEQRSFRGTIPSSLQALMRV